MFSASRHIILGIIDFFHRPFAKLIPLQTFRYLACGGSNTVLNWVIYSVVFNNGMHKNDLHLVSGLFITARVFAWVVSFAITFPLGFILSRHIVFPESNLHGRVQFFRYAVVTVVFILLTYLLIKFFGFVLPMVRADISYIFIMAITAVLSYISQRIYTFTVKEPKPQEILETEDEIVA